MKRTPYGQPQIDSVQLQRQAQEKQALKPKWHDDGDGYGDRSLAVSHICPGCPGSEASGCTFTPSGALGGLASTASPSKFCRAHSRALWYLSGKW
mmetsp:Transcript_21903/g.29656  ORF Transcript_21903/g.29656 Transcript_21903/m.29656 type:complete len:95 (-) Transcript_21903:196-480(-)